MFHVKILISLGSFTVIHKFLQEKELMVSLFGVPCGHLKFKSACEQILDMERVGSQCGHNWNYSLFPAQIPCLSLDMSLCSEQNNPD